MLAAYATVKNPCANAAAITRVAGSDFGMAMIHETTMVNGMSGMRHVEALSISAKGEVRFAPGASHIMLMQPKREFHEGDKTRLTFHLADGRVISADFVVRREAP